MLNGDGSFESNNGFVYEGEFVDLTCCGVGQLTYVDGSCYMGQWENDLMHGMEIKFWLFFFFSGVVLRRPFLPSLRTCSVALP